MKYIKFIGLILLLLLAAAAIYIIYTPGIHRDPDPGPDFAHEGLDDIKYGKCDKIREYIPLKDGTQLAATILLPNHTDTQKFPGILEYLPYAGSGVVPEMSWMERIIFKVLSDVLDTSGLVTQLQFVHLLSAVTPAT